MFGGFPSPSVIEMSFSAAAVGDSNSVITFDFSFGFNASIIFIAINSFSR